MRYNDLPLDFTLTPSEGEFLWRKMNLLLNTPGLEEHEVASIERFQERVLEFTRKHPCKYGEEARI